jgi:hypothetical protein
MRLLMTSIVHATQNIELPAFFQSLAPTLKRLLLGISTMQTFKSHQMTYSTWCHCKPTAWYLNQANLQILADDVQYLIFTWCHCKSTAWYLHHANLQISSDDVLYMVSPQTSNLAFPPCKPSNLIRWCKVHGVNASLLLGISTMWTYKSYWYYMASDCIVIDHIATQYTDPKTSEFFKPSTPRNSSNLSEATQ